MQRLMKWWWRLVWSRRWGRKEDGREVVEVAFACSWWRVGGGCVLVLGARGRWCDRSLQCSWIPRVIDT
jgi:hypothetical protein